MSYLRLQRKRWASVYLYKSGPLPDWNQQLVPLEIRRATNPLLSIHGIVSVTHRRSHRDDGGPLLSTALQEAQSISCQYILDPVLKQLAFRLSVCLREEQNRGQRLTASRYSLSLDPASIVSNLCIDAGNMDGIKAMTTSFLHSESSSHTQLTPSEILRVLEPSSRPFRRPQVRHQILQAPRLPRGNSLSRKFLCGRSSLRERNCPLNSRGVLWPCRRGQAPSRVR